MILTGQCNLSNARNHYTIYTSPILWKSDQSTMSYTIITLKYYYISYHYTLSTYSYTIYII